jgi:hypothetical protein
MEALSISSNTCVGPLKMGNPYIFLFDGVLSAPNEYHMQKFLPQEVDVSTNHIEAHKPFGISSSGVRVLNV